ncbi:hypothetical protein B5C26_02910 [Photorhabdus luminescens]|uniref:DUF1367 family protein n=1 Tax=Photorhabdus luminescens TaxID=29488 RepID=UPI000B4DB22B|nr:DUF1367 family protein [Photorhabdus luminescens]OWO84003.1 hypothetical protein B5C26_02910 [Photorhabdus luminescens]
MAQYSFIKISNDTLAPATPAAREYLHFKVKCGDILSANFKKARNPRFHRKYFALLNLGYEYWEPTGGTISPEEKSLVRGYVKFLAHFAGSEDALLSAADEYLTGVSKDRVQNISATKSFDAFRRWVTVESGHYDTYEMPDSSLYREPRSISFAKMDELEFHDLYQATLNVLWNFILYRTFPTRAGAENAAAQLFDFVN